MHRLAISLAWFLAACLALAQPAPFNLVTRHYPADHFSISVPSGWIEIPRAELDRAEAAARKAVPNGPAQRLTYGFQASQRSAYPRFVIQVRTTGRWSEELISKMRGPGQEMGEVQRILNSASPALAAAKLQLGKLTWDPKTRMAWMRAQLTSPDGIPVAALLGAKPTEIGSIQVNCYSRQSDFELLAGMFEAIIASVNVDDPFEYHERSLGARAVESISGPAVIGLFIGAIAVLVVVVARRPRTDSTPPIKTRRGVWMLPVGVLFLFAAWRTLAGALGGDGWLQSTYEAQGYWGFWGFSISIGLSLISFGLRAFLRDLRR